MIAALYVQTGGVYYGLPDVDPWDETRDARQYAGPWPVVAHPPCARWSRLAGFTEARFGYKRGDDRQPRTCTAGCTAGATCSAEKAARARHRPPSVTNSSGSLGARFPRFAILERPSAPLEGALESSGMRARLEGYPLVRKTTRVSSTGLVSPGTP